MYTLYLTFFNAIFLSTVVDLVLQMVDEIRIRYLSGTVFVEVQHVFKVLFGLELVEQVCLFVQHLVIVVVVQLQDHFIEVLVFLVIEELVA